MNQKTLISLVLFLVILSVAASAFSISDGRKQISGLVSEGGINLTDNLAGDPIKYRGYVTIGQSVINPETELIDHIIEEDEIIGGNLTSENYTLCLGVFCTNVFEIPHKINMSGSIKYDDTEGAVSNSEAIVKIKYGLASFESEPVETDENGRFDVEFSIPERIAIYPFDIVVYAKGRIEAEYRCTYNHETGHCDA